jgi:hypothetical protein
MKETAVNKMHFMSTFFNNYLFANNALHFLTHQLGKSFSVWELTAGSKIIHCDYWVDLISIMFLVSFSGGRFCSFSPSIEQSQKVCISLEENGFVEIQSLEILQNEEIVKMKNIPVMDLEFLKHKVSVDVTYVKYIFFKI